MKLSDQVITREQAQRLKELGVDGDSLFAWQETGFPEPWEVVYPSYSAREVKKESPELVKWIPAWTTSELGRALGSATFAAQKFHDAVMARINSSHSMTIACAPQFVGGFLIAAIEHEVLKVSEVNERLKA